MAGHRSRHRVRLRREDGKGNPSQEIKGDQKIGPGEDIELLWVGEAVSVAKSAAEKSRMGERPVAGVRARGSPIG